MSDDYIKIILGTIEADIKSAVATESPVPDTHLESLSVPGISKRDRNTPQIFISLSQLFPGTDPGPTLQMESWEMLVLVEVVEPENSGTSLLLPKIYGGLVSNPRRGDNAHDTRLIDAQHGPIDENAKYFLTSIVISVRFFAMRGSLIKPTE